MEYVQSKIAVTVAITDKSHCSMNCSFLKMIPVSCCLYSKLLTYVRNAHDTSILRCEECKKEFGVRQ